MKRLVGILLAASLAFSLFACSPKVDHIKLKESSLELRVGDTSPAIGYTILPEQAADTAVVWSSSDETVATVAEDGTITAVGDGECEIAVAAQSCIDSVTVTVKSGPDFAAVYDEYCDASWATLSKDGSYLSVDTNPYDADDYLNLDAVDAIPDINAALGLPESLWEKMNHSSALDGRQSYEYGNIEVSWKYHPDHGLEIIYTANDGSNDGIAGM